MTTLVDAAQEPCRGPVGCNCSVVVCPVTHEALIVDPGGDAGRILALLPKLGARPVGIVHTHGHFDHILGTREVAMATGAPVSIHADDLDLYRAWCARRAPSIWSSTNLPNPHRSLPAAKYCLRPAAGSRAAYAGTHPGSICVFIEATGEAPLLLAGDTLFEGGIGRTDFSGGSLEQILHSIRDTLFQAARRNCGRSGHGPETTIGEEREGNPYVGRRASAG